MYGIHNPKLIYLNDWLIVHHLSEVYKLSKGAQEHEARNDLLYLTTPEWRLFQIRDQFPATFSCGFPLLDPALISGSPCLGSSGATGVSKAPSPRGPDTTICACTCPPDFGWHGACTSCQSSSLSLILTWQPKMDYTWLGGKTWARVRKGQRIIFPHL